MTATIIIASIVFILMIISIIFDLKIKLGKVSFCLYWVFALLGAVLLICIGEVSLKQILQNFTTNLPINPIKILIIFFSMTCVSVLLDEIGFFKYLAYYALKKAKTSQRRLFIYFYIVISLLTIVTSNDIIILTFTPFICYFTKHARINPIPYIVMEFVAANTWSLLLIIGNPTNIYLATFFGIDFVDYFLVMALPTMVCGLTSFGIMYLLFRKNLSAELEPTEELIPVPNKPLMYSCCVGLIIYIIGMAVASYINMQMYLVGLIVSLAVFAVCIIISLIKKYSLRPIGQAVKKLPYALTPFLLSMFVIVLAFENCGLIGKISSFLNGKSPFIVGIASFLSANLINNIPMSVLFASALENVVPQGVNVFAAIMGSNIGAFLTPIGALAGIMYVKILKDNSVNYSFRRFVLYGLLIAVPVICAGLTVLTLMN
ncbi:MAG: ArsB/NhaD family transporter [Clostridia bacterium]